jgi:MFS family permease
MIPYFRRSIFTVSIFTFCTAIQFTLYFSSLWPFLQTVDSTATENFYGIIVAAYSLGQILSGPVIARWATKTKSIVAPAQFCLFLTLVGNVIYVIASVLPSHQKWCVLVGRFFVGKLLRRRFLKITKAYFAMSVSQYVCQQFPAKPPILNGFPPISMH